MTFLTHTKNKITDVNDFGLTLCQIWIMYQVGSKLIFKNVIDIETVSYY